MYAYLFYMCLQINQTIDHLQNYKSQNGKNRYLLMVKLTKHS